jgi:hypothetical protein
MFKKQTRLKYESFKQECERERAMKTGTGSTYINKTEMTYQS